MKSFISIDGYEIVGRGIVYLVDTEETLDLGEEIVLNGLNVVIRGIERQGRNTKIGLLVREKVMNTIDNSMVNKGLLKEVINQIISDPKSWHQGAWHTSCGTSHCFAGWCELITTGEEKNDDVTEDVARQALGISPELANEFFDGDNSFNKLYLIAQALINDKIDSEGYNARGFDMAGEDRDGVWDSEEDWDYEEDLSMYKTL